MADIADIVTKESNIADIQLTFNDPKAFAKQLQELQWKAQILDTLHDTDGFVGVPQDISDPKVKELALHLQDLQQKARIFDDIKEPSKAENSDLQGRLKDALSARKELITRLRKVRENRAQWVQYANSLSKRLEKREGTWPTQRGAFPKQGQRIRAP
jgi:hypothetical protein